MRAAPRTSTADETEIDYLIAAVNRYFKEKLRREDVITTFSGVRPLFDDGKGNPSAVTRDYVFDLDETGGAPLLNVFGGKITTFRELAERGMHKLDRIFPQMGGDWTETAAASRRRDPRRRLRAVRRRPAHRLSVDAARARSSTTAASTAPAPSGSSAPATSTADLGRHFGAQLYEAEVRYLVAHEWAQTPQDVLHRRTKQELHLTAAERAAFAAWFDAELARRPPEPCRSTLSLNTNPLVNRFADPDDLIDTVARDLKLRDLQLTHEFINPSWPAPVIRRLTRQMVAALARTGVRVTSGMTGPYGRLNHFGHPGRDVRRYYVDWFKTFADITADLGGSLGRHPVRHLHLPRLRRSGPARGADPDRHRLLGRGGRARQGRGARLCLLGADERRARVRRDHRGMPEASGPADRRRRWRCRCG